MSDDIYTFGPGSPINSAATTTADHVTIQHKLDCKDQKVKPVLIEPSDFSYYYRVHHTADWLDEIKNQWHKHGDWFGKFRPTTFKEAKDHYNLPKDLKKAFLFEFYFDVPFRHSEYCYMESLENKTEAWQALLTQKLVSTIKLVGVTELR